MNKNKSKGLESGTQKTKVQTDLPEVRKERKNRAKGMPIVKVMATKIGE